MLVPYNTSIVDISNTMGNLNMLGMEMFCRARKLFIRGDPGGLRYRMYSSIYRNN